MFDWYCIDGVRRNFALVTPKRHGASECNGDSECPVSEFSKFSTSWNGLCNLWSLTAFKAVLPFKLLQPFTIDCEICEVKLSSLAGDQGSGWSRTKVVLLFLASFLIRYISGEGGYLLNPSPVPPFPCIDSFNRRNDWKRKCSPHYQCIDFAVDKHIVITQFSL